MKISLPRIRVLVQKEFRQLFRDPKTKRIVFAAPIIQLLLFGYAVNTDVRNVATVVVDQDQTTESRLLKETLTASGYFRIVQEGQESGDIERALDAGSAAVGLQIPPGFARDLKAGRESTVQILIDGTNSNTATVAQGYAGRIIQDFAVEQAAARGVKLEGGMDFRARIWYNPDLSSQVYNVPGVIGLLLLLMALLLTALAVVRERELGTLEQLMVTPIDPRELILGKTIPAMIICMVDLVLITVIAILWFQIPLRGSVPALALASFLYVLAGLGLGLFISTISRTQQEAFLTMFLFILPAIILAGFLYPVETMPVSFRYLTLLNPVRYFMEVVRGIFLKGQGVVELWSHFLVLALMGVLAIWGAGKRFQKRLE
ncbi:MAG: ABC transporter permease [Longimicrobiales bacterium]